jgi:sarcosine oxidase
MDRNGGLMIGPPNGVLVRGVLASANEHRVPHEVLLPAELREWFPRYAVQENWIGIFEPGAGYLRPEPIIRAHLELAERHGADVVTDTRVIGWEGSAEGTRVRVAGQEFQAARLVIAAGAWTASLVPELRGLLHVERQVSHWFAPVDGRTIFGPASMPITMWELDEGRLFYATPDIGRGVKTAFHHGGEFVTTDSVRRTVALDEVEEARSVLRRVVPGAAGECLGSAICLYTDTPDEHFVIDWHPAHARVLILSPCSGHGFKFSSAIGEIAADLVEGKEPQVDLAPFRLSRFRLGESKADGSDPATVHRFGIRS